MVQELTAQALFDLSHTAAAELFAQEAYPWEILAKIGDFVRAYGASLPAEEYDHPEEEVWIAKSAKVYPTATILGPCVIGPNTEVRPGAFLRGNILVGEGCVVGNSTELKNVILFDGVQVPHYNYVGDSVLGYKAHMGAGSITSNVRGDRALVVVHGPEGDIPTGRKKVGAFLGDHAEIGCGTVLNPGSVVGRRAQVYPLSMIRGFVPAGMLYKKAGEVASRPDLN
ncbi:MAG: UDP-N-acetylglucosamine pyrophosphorylase [Lachnospiraceae bacterium]|nr:UDP-N-acetylglucosamine pyrophosphorylase [Lachnospiraceae bacterium]